MPLANRSLFLLSLLWRLFPLTALVVVVGMPTGVEAQATFRGGYDAYEAAPAMRGTLSRALPRGLRVAGRDAQRRSPSLLLGSAPLPQGAGNTAAQRAARHLASLAPLYGLTSADLDTAELVLARPTGGGGALVIYRQRVDGVEVFDTRASLLLDSRGRLRAAGGQLRGATGRPYAFAHGPASAVTTALADCWGRRAPGASLVSPSPIARRHQADVYFVPTAAAGALGYALDRPARARRVLFPMPTHLVAATYVELWVTDAGRGPVLVAYVVSAEDQSILHRRLLTEDDSFRYTVFADTAAPFLPVDGPFGDVTPDAAGTPIDALPSYVPQGVVTMEGFNSNPAGAADPWLPSGATQSRGNNVDAYADLASPDGFSAGDLRASTTAPGVFDHVLDPMREPDADDTQKSAVVTQLFYVNNWLHDYFYDLGFTEAAGNAQEDNFGRGGEAGDRLRVESMDHGGVNNANMSTPIDGSSPRMQMFLWRGRAVARVEADGASYDVGVATWGPSIFDQTAPTVLVDDGVATGTDACEVIAADLSGQIALIDRGNCTFGVKVRNAQVAGAVGAIVMNNRAGGTTRMSGTPPGPITIPALFVSQGDGTVLRSAALGMATRMFRAPSVPRPDSSLDATVVVHEWGHYLNNRLINGSSRQRRAMGEGWGDLLALVMLARPTDDFAGAHPHAGFANQGREFIYFGTRRVPFSTSRALNDLSFRHISVGQALPTLHPLDASSSNNAEVHNAGEVWATMMFEAFASLADRSREPSSPYTFEEMRARFAAYVVLGMQLAPRNPTYTEQRDAFLAAALDTDLEDARRIALAFARRGAGTCAEAPSRGSTDLVGVVEDFTVGAVGSLGGLEIEADGPGRLCDADGLLDAGENGLVRMVIHNTGLIAFSEVAVQLGAGDPAVTFPAGSVWAVSDLGPGETEELSIPIDVDEAGAIAGYVVVAATLSAPAFCRALRVERTVPMDRDEAPSALETFEVLPGWLRESSLDGTSVGVWSVGPSTLGGVTGTLRAVDTASVSDTAVELPEVTASATEPLVLTFEHRFDFEASPTVLWDGGVVEVSTDGGGTWVDVDGYVDPGYTGALSDRAGSPLSLRRAYSGTNPSAPTADVVRLDFGSAFAAMPVRFRFRVGADEATGGPGWEIDDVFITGGDPAPFTAFEADTADCAEAPVADAGPDVEVYSGELFALDAAASFDPNDDPLTFSWEQVSGEPLFDLAAAMTEAPEVTAPAVGAPTDVTLRVRVSNGSASSTDDVRVRILAALPPADAGTPMLDTGTMSTDGAAAGDVEVDAGHRGIGGGGCSCRAATPPPGRHGGGLWLLGAIMAALRLRRRVSAPSSK